LPKRLALSINHLDAVDVRSDRFLVGKVRDGGLRRPACGVERALTRRAGCG
jgi:hypothetical protein